MSKPLCAVLFLLFFWGACQSNPSTNSENHFIPLKAPVFGYNGEPFSKTSNISLANDKAFSFLLEKRDSVSTEDSGLVMSFQGSIDQFTLFTETGLWVWDENLKRNFYEILLPQGQKVWVNGVGVGTATGIGTGKLWNTKEIPRLVARGGKITEEGVWKKHTLFTATGYRPWLEPKLQYDLSIIDSDLYFFPEGSVVRVFDALKEKLLVPKDWQTPLFTDSELQESQKILLHYQLTAQFKGRFPELLYYLEFPHRGFVQASQLIQRVQMVDGFWVGINSRLGLVILSLVDSTILHNLSSPQAGFQVQNIDVVKAFAPERSLIKVDWIQSDRAQWGSAFEKEIVSRGTEWTSLYSLEGNGQPKLQASWWSRVELSNDTLFQSERFLGNQLILNKSYSSEKEKYQQILNWNGKDFVRVSETESPDFSELLRLQLPGDE